MDGNSHCGEHAGVSGVPGGQVGSAPDGRDNKLLSLWRRARGFPGGRWLVGRLVGWNAPFTGVLRARIQELEPGYSRLTVCERRRLRQHLGSLHAGALFTLAESASGLAMAAALPSDARAIVTAATIDFLKKARGRLIAECRCEIPDARERREHEVHVEVTDATGDTVARERVRWLIGPRRGSPDVS